MSVAPALIALALAIPNTPYVRSRADSAVPNDPNAHCLWWHEGTVTYQQATKGNSLVVPAGSEFTAVTRSFDSWQKVMDECGNLTLVEGPRLADTQIGADPASTDNHNLVVFRQTFCADVVPSNAACWHDESCMNVYDCWEWSHGTIGLTTTTYEKASGRIYDADIELNASPDKATGARFHFTTADSPGCPTGGPYLGCVSTDVQNTVTHEAGHVIGLDHTSYPGSTMNLSAPAGETSKRVIDPGSKSFVCDAYPKGEPSRDCVINPLPADLGPAAAGCAASGGPPALLALGALLGCLRSRRRCAR